MEELQNQIDQYSDLAYQCDALTIKKQSLIEEIMTPEIKAKLVEIDAEFDPILLQLNLNKSVLERNIKEQILTLGRTVSGIYHCFRWSRPRVTWDTRALDGYGAAHPEILQFRKEGKPIISVRKL